MRTARWLRCAAATAGGVEAAVGAAKLTVETTKPKGAAPEATAAPPPSSDASPSKADKKKKSAAKTLSFNILRFKPWQMVSLDGKGTSEAVPAVLYHGDKLGPRPLVILDHSASSLKPEDCTAAAKKYEAMLSQLAWGYGAVYIPLCTTAEGDPTMLLQDSSRQVCATLDALDVRWSHFLTHGYGALVAASMAASTTCPHRLGTLLLLDTPLITPELVENTAQRVDIAKATEDVNVPEAELAFAKENLLSHLEGMLPYADESDKILYEQHLFNPSAIFRDGGLVREEATYVPVRYLSQIYHPLQMVVPSSKPLMDVAAHKDLFRVRRPATIKTASGHADLFTSGATEVADVVRAWMQRFELDVVLARRYEQASKEMEQLMQTSAPAGGDGAAAALDREPKKKKKEKKTKK